MQIHKTLGFKFKTIANLIKRSLNESFQDEECEGVTGVHGMTIGYIYDESKNRDVFQRDIEKEFKIRRSTATGILRLMEQNGLLVREPVEYDARLKKLILTSKAANTHELFQKKVSAVEEKIIDGFTDDELNELFHMLERIRKNLERV